VRGRGGFESSLGHSAGEGRIRDNDETDIITLIFWGFPESKRLGTGKDSQEKNLGGVTKTWSGGTRRKKKLKG